MVTLEENLQLFYMPSSDCSISQLESIPIKIQRLVTNVSCAGEDQTELLNSYSAHCLPSYKWNSITQRRKNYLWPTFPALNNWMHIYYSSTCQKLLSRATKTAHIGSQIKREPCFPLLEGRSFWLEACLVSGKWNWFEEWSASLLNRRRLGSVILLLDTEDIKM